MDNMTRKINRSVVSSQSTLILEWLLSENLGTPVLSLANATQNIRNIELEQGHGFTGVPADEQYIELMEESLVFDTVFWMQSKVLSLQVDTPIAGTDTITIDMVVNYPYSKTQAKVRRSCPCININGSVTDPLLPGSDRMFIFDPPPLSTHYFESTRAMVAMAHGSAGDLDTFGDLPALSNGIEFGGIVGGYYRTLFVARKNADFSLSAYDVDFPLRSGGGGSFGTTVRRTWSGKDKENTGVAIIGGYSKVQATVRDDLTALGSFFIKLHGNLQHIRNLRI